MNLPPLIDLCALFESNGRGAPIGTKHQWKTGTVVKTKRGWKPVGSGEPSGKTPAQPPASPPKQLDFSPKWPKEGQVPSSNFVPIPKHEKWVAPVHEPRSSMEKHFRGGRPTEERRQLHKKIFAAFLDPVKPVPKDKKPMAAMLMGGPASGKGVLADSVPDDEFVKVDADKIKSLIPEYQELVKKGDRNAAAYVHEESGYLASKLRDIARSQRKNMVLDGTGKYAGSYLHRMQELQSDGYHVHLMMPYLDVDTAVKRAKKRGKESGRWVPEHVIRSNHDVIPGNFLQLAKRADTALLFDNRMSPGPRIVWSRTQDSEIDHDPKFMNWFRKKYGQKPQPPPATPQTSQAVTSDLHRLFSEVEEKKPWIDPMELGKEIVKSPKHEPEEDGDFGEHEGLVLPEPDDSAILDSP